MQRKPISLEQVRLGLCEYCLTYKRTTFVHGMCLCYYCSHDELLLDRLAAMCASEDKNGTL